MLEPIRGFAGNPEQDSRLEIDMETEMDDVPEMEKDRSCDGFDVCLVREGRVHDNSKIAYFFWQSDRAAINMEEEMEEERTKLGATSMSSIFLLFSWTRLAVIQVFIV